MHSPELSSNECECNFYQGYIMKTSEIAKIEDVNKRVSQTTWFLYQFNNRYPSIALLLIASDIIFQRVSKVTIVMANSLWKDFDAAEVTWIGVELPPIVPLIANHNPDFQPGEEAFALLDDMVKVE